MKAALLVLICAVLCVPVWLMVTNSFTDTEAFLRVPPRVLPGPFTLGNYRAVFGLQLFGRWVMNSAVVVALLVAGGLLVNGAAGYVFAFCHARWTKPVFWLMMAPIFVTRFVLIISQFVVVGRLGLRGFPAVLVMSMLWPTGIFLFRNFFSGVPRSLIDIARLDGAGEGTILFQVVLPLCKPIVGAAIVFLAMGAMGDYIWQMLNLQVPQQQTLLVGLVNTTIDVRVVNRIGYDLAVGSILFAPYLLLFAFTSQYFVKGLTLGGLKE